MYQADIYLHQEKECVLSRVAAAAGEPLDVHIEELHDHKVTFIVAAEGCAETCGEVLQGDGHVEHVERLDGDNFLVTKPSCGAYSAVSQNHAILRRRNVVSNRRREYTVLFFDRAHLKSIVGGFEEIGSVRLGTLTQVEREGHLLTDRQREVVDLALAAGYYQWPRAANSEELASEMGISRATFLEHLRKAERKLLTHLLGDEGATAGTPRQL